MKMSIKNASIIMVCLLGSFELGRCDIPSAVAEVPTSRDLHNLISNISAHGRIIGMEVNPICNQRLPIDKIPIFTGEVDLNSISKVISDATDYQCQTTADAFLIFPKEEPSRYNHPLIIRKIDIPSLKNVSLLDFYTKITGANNPASFAFVPTIFDGPMYIRKATISLQPGTEQCSDVMNKLAQQLHARYWAIYDVEALGKGQTSPELPMNIRAGEVLFSK